MSPALQDADNRRVDAAITEPCPPVDATITDYADLVGLRKEWARHEAVPVLVAAREDAADRSWAGLDVRTVVRGEQSAGRFAAHSVVLAPGAGMPTHYLEDVHTYLLVAAGEAEFGVGSLVETVGQHSLGYVPPRTRQSFRNACDAPVTLVLVHSQAGSDCAFAAAHQRWLATGATDVADYQDMLELYGFRFDDEKLPNDEFTNIELPPLEFEFRGEGDMDALRELFRSRSAVPRLVRTTPDELDTSVTGETRRKQLLNGDVTGGNAMLNLLSGVPGFGAPRHHQPTEEEFFFITDGLLQMDCATEYVELRPGAIAFCPRNCTHGFRNTTEVEARFVTLNSPAGHERSMAAVRKLAQAGATREQLYELSVAGGFVFHSHDALG